MLVGDFLFAKGLLLSIDNDDFDLLKHISIAVREMSEGELLQIEKARQLNITEDVYFEIIRKKTAALIASCTAIGAASMDVDRAEVERMRKFGELIGIAFQIKDDLFDYTEDKIGKPTGIAASTSGSHHGPTQPFRSGIFESAGSPAVESAKPRDKIVALSGQQKNRTGNAAYSATEGQP